MNNTKLIKICRVLCIIMALAFVLISSVSCDNQSASNAVSDVIEGIDGKDGKDGLDGKDGVDGANGQDGKDGINGIDGKDGKSAYELAVENGFEGTLQEWLDSLACDCEGSEANNEAAELKELLTLKKELRVNEDGSFRVVVFSDIHFYNATELAESDTLKYINSIVDKENPNLVLFAGDNWWGLNTEKMFRDYIKVLVKHIEEKQIPWAHVYGNHDDEINYGGWYTSIHQSEQQKICEEFEYCVSKSGDPTISGVGNYVLPVLSYDGSKIAYNIWGLDSGSYSHIVYNGNIVDSFTLNGKTVTNTFDARYEGIRESQVEWYAKASKLLEEYNGEKVPAMMYFHIPLQETYTAWKLAVLHGKNGVESKRLSFMEIKGTKGNEGVCAPAYNAGLFEKVVERGDVKLITYGHDHVSDFTVEYKGVNLCYVPAITTRSGVTGANNSLMGGRVIDFSEKTGEITTRMSFVSDLPDPDLDTESPIINMVIKDNGTVENGSDNRAPIVSHDFSGSTKTVSKDAEINMNAITFDGVSGTPSVYNIDASKLTPLLKDGFSYEIMFKVDSASFNPNYVGIFDFEEGGGFGLNVYKKSGDTTKYTLKAEVAVGSGWNSDNVDLEVGKWYHCVYVFNGNSTAVYINGVKVAGTDNITDTYRAPSFANRTGEEYICIGACAQAWNGSTKSNGINGMTGSIAILNLLPGTLTEAEAIALYNAVK